MNKVQLIEAVASKNPKLSKADVGRVIEAVTSIIEETLKNRQEVAIAGFGTFRTKAKKARTARNPKTGETVQVLAKTVPQFKAAKALKEAVK